MSVLLLQSSSDALGSPRGTVVNYTGVWLDDGAITSATMQPSQPLCRDVLHYVLFRRLDSAAIFLSRLDFIL